MSQGYYINILRVRSLGRAFPASPYRAGARLASLRGTLAVSGARLGGEPPGDLRSSRQGEPIHFVMPDGVPEMMTVFHVTGGYTYVDPYGKALGYEDVFTKLQACGVITRQIGPRGRFTPIASCADRRT